MAISPKRLLLALAALAAGVVVWHTTAPAALGGSANYSITSGISMEPRFHTGDLAVVRQASVYRVGDIVLYLSPVIHRPVLHRIIKIQNGHYFFKGDNNNFVDPGYATRSELVGKLWVRIPWVGHILTWLASPLKASLVVALALFLLLGGFSGLRWRRRRAPRPRPELPARGFRRAPGKLALVGGAVLGLVACVFAIAGFGSPLTRTAANRSAYQETGAFSYSARTDRKSTAYPSGVIRTGEPIFLSIVDKARFGFSYRFVSTLPHAVHGTIALAVDLSSDTSSYHQTLPLGPVRSFTGDGAEAGYVLSVSQVKQYLAGLATESGAPGSLTASFRAVVHVRGYVDGKPLSETFAPTLETTVTAAAIQVVATTPTAPPGATYSPPTPAQALAATLHPVQAGTETISTENDLTALGVSIAADDLRLLALVLGALAVPLVVFGWHHRSRYPTRASEDRIAALYRLTVVPVLSLAGGGERAIEVLDFASLARLARYTQRPVLLERGDDERLYGIEEDGHFYVYRAAGRGAPAPETVVPAAPLPRPRTRRIGLLRPGAAIFAFVLISAVATSFTATSTVPQSYAGTSNQPLTLAQLAPPLCAAVGATQLVVATGSTVAGAAGNDLILGKSGAGTFNLLGNGGDDCLVGGGGPGTTNKFDGGNGTNVCIGAPGAVNTFKNCQITG